MKHTPKITTYLIILFLLSQFIGLFVVQQYITTDNLGNRILEQDANTQDIPKEQSIYYMAAAIAMGTVFFFILNKYKLFNVWKFMFIFAAIITMNKSFQPFIGASALGVASVLAIWKVFKPNIFIHNFTELFIYGGLAAIFAPLLNITRASILLILISIYDMYAVWKSKHMIKLAEFQKESKVFAGLYIPSAAPVAPTTTKTSNKKTASKTTTKKVKQVRVQSAILGGGDIGFPLMFAAVFLPTYGLTTLIIPVTTTIALYTLFYKAQQGKYYPAMPFLSIGAFIGAAIVLLI